MPGSFINVSYYPGPNIHITFSFFRYLQEEELGLTLIEIEIPTGYEACEDLDGDPLCMKQVKSFSLQVHLSNEVCANTCLFSLWRRRAET